MIQPLADINPAFLPGLIFCARIMDVSIGTMRMICVVRGYRVVSIILAFFETLIWITAVTSVLSHLDRVSNILAYAAGFAAGNAVGMWIDRRIALGKEMVTFISRGSAHAVAECLRFAGLGVTTMNAQGQRGPVAMCMSVVPRKRMPEVMRIAREIDPNVHVTVSDVRETTLAMHGMVLPGKVPFRLPSFAAFRRQPQMAVSDVAMTPVAAPETVSVSVKSSASREAKKEAAAPVLPVVEPAPQPAVASTIPFCPEELTTPATGAA